MSNQQSLKDLTKIWYKKLKDTGFKDVEQDENNLIEWSQGFGRRRLANNSPDVNLMANDKETRYETQRVVNEGKAEYYRLAEHFLYDHVFETKLDKKIWAMHVEGKSYREIATALRSKTTKVNLNKDNVQIIVNKYADIMKEQMHAEDGSRFTEGV